MQSSNKRANFILNKIDLLLIGAGLLLVLIGFFATLNYVDATDNVVNSRNEDAYNNIIADTKFSLSLDPAPTQTFVYEDLKPDVVVDNEALFFRNNIQFPYSYKITGSGDTSWIDLAMRFYQNPNLADLIAYRNPLLDNDDLLTGVDVVIPDPRSNINAKSFVDMIKHSRILTTPKDQVISETGTLQLTAQEFDLFTRVIAAEAGANWSYRGVRLIAESITNRVRMTGENFYTVLTKPEQYSVVTSGRYLEIEPTALHIQVAKEALHGNIYLDNDVQFFCTNEAYEQTPWFKTLEIVTIYDNTIFMRSKR